MLINLESFTKKSIHQLLRDFHTTRPLSIYAALSLPNSGNLRLGPHHSFHPRTSGQFYFRLSWATHGSHPRLIHISPHLSCLHIKGAARPCGSYHFWKKPWNVMENETMEILNGVKVPLRDNKGATGRKLYLRHHLADFNVSSFLDLYTCI